MRFDLPTQEIPLVQCNTVESNAQRLVLEHERGCVQMSEVDRMIGRLATVGCVDCWLNQRSDAISHDHPESIAFTRMKRTLRSLRFEYMKEWPFCYVCWVPYRPPCSHPPQEYKTAVDPSKCPR